MECICTCYYIIYIEARYETIFQANNHVDVSNRRIRRSQEGPVEASRGQSNRLDKEKAALIRLPDSVQIRLKTRLKKTFKKTKKRC